MIRNNKIITGFIFLLSAMLIHFSRAQGWNCFSTSCGPKHQQWVINVNSGATSYFGDLSIYDTQPIQKLAYESGFAFGLIGTRYFNKTLGVSIQLLNGKLQATHRNISFESSIFEYNLHGRINMLGLLNKNFDRKIKWDIYAGVGQFFYESLKYIELGPDSNPQLHQTRIPEFVYFFGSGLSVPVTPCLSLTSDLALRQCQTDRLDDYLRKKDYDYYTYLSVGLSLYLSDLKASRFK